MKLVVEKYDHNCISIWNFQRTNLKCYLKNKWVRGHFITQWSVGFLICSCTWNPHHDLWWVFLVAHFFTSSSFGFLVALSFSWSPLFHLSAPPKSCLVFQTQVENRRDERFLQKLKYRHYHRTLQAHCIFTERKQQHLCTMFLQYCPELPRLWFILFYFSLGPST